MLEKMFRVIELNNGKKKLSIEFTDKNYGLLSTLFFVEIDSLEEWIKNHITDVLQGKAEKRDISGNICELIIDRENTFVYDMLARDGKGNWCSIPTQELLLLIDEWHEQESMLNN